MVAKDEDYEKLGITKEEVDQLKDLDKNPPPPSPPPILMPAPRDKSVLEERIASGEVAMLSKDIKKEVTSEYAMPKELAVLAMRGNLKETQEYLNNVEQAKLDAELNTLDAVGKTVLDYLIAELEREVGKDTVDRELGREVEKPWFSSWWNSTTPESEAKPLSSNVHATNNLSMINFLIESGAKTSAQVREEERRVATEEAEKQVQHSKEVAAKIAQERQTSSPQQISYNNVSAKNVGPQKENNIPFWKRWWNKIMGAAPSSAAETVQSNSNNGCTSKKPQEHSSPLSPPETPQSRANARGGFWSFLGF